MEIGFSQPVELEWLNAAADWTAAGYPPEEVRQMLDELLATKIAVGTTSKKSSRYKRLAILMTTWVTPRLENVQFRDHALGLLSFGNSRVALHYAMLSATYPFFWSVCSQIGRMLRLQDAITMTQIKRRCKEALGERDTVAYASTRVVKTLVDLGLLMRGKRIGEYAAPDQRVSSEMTAVGVLLEGGMRAEGKRTTLLEGVVAAPGFFTFSLRTSGEIARQQFSLLRITGGEHGGERVTICEVAI